MKAHPLQGAAEFRKNYEHALHASHYDVKCDNVSIDQAVVVARKAKVVRTLVFGVRAKMKGAGVTVVMEKALITGKTGDGFTLIRGKQNLLRQAPDHLHRHLPRSASHPGGEGKPGHQKGDMLSGEKGPVAKCTIFLQQALLIAVY